MTTADNQSIPDGRREVGNATRDLILDAAIDCLSELGFSRTSTVEICRRAGVSRGAQTHHFPRKSGLLSEAIDHLARRRLEEIERTATSLGQGDVTPELVLDLLWGTFTGPLFRAALELEVAAHTDPELLSRVKPVEKQIGDRILQTVRKLLPADLTSEPHFRAWFHFAWGSMRGLASLRAFRRSTALEAQTWAFARPVLAAALRNGVSDVPARRASEVKAPSGSRPSSARTPS